MGGVTGKVSTGVRAYFGFPPPRPRPTAGRSVSGRNGYLRRLGRALVVRGLAQVAFWPGWWGAGVALVAFAAPGPWWLASVAVTVPCVPLTLSILTRSDHRSSEILMAASRRVKSLKLRRRLRRGWMPEMVSLKLTQQQKRRDMSVTVAPTLGRVAVTAWGVRCDHVSLQDLGLPVSELAKYGGHLASRFRVPWCEIGEVTSGIARLEMRHSDPLAKPVQVEDLPAPRRHLHVVTRVTEEGEGLEQDVVLPHLVIGGQGSGKSTDLWTFFHQLQEAGIPFRARVFDPKGGMELGELRQAAYDYESTATAWPAFLTRALTALSGRQRRMAARNWQKLYQFTESDPLDVMVIDELLAVLAMRNREVQIGKTGTLKAGDAFDLYLSQARAAGFTVIALSQLGQKELIGHARGLFPHLTVLRVPQSEKEIVDRLLGSADRHPAHLIPATGWSAGIGYSRTEAGRIVRTRGARLSEKQRKRVIERMQATSRTRANGRKSDREMAEAAA